LGYPVFTHARALSVQFLGLPIIKKKRLKGKYLSVYMQTTTYNKKIFKKFLIKNQDQLKVLK